MTAPIEVFVSERPRLVGLAYRMLGSRSDAEDVVQDAWLRWQAVAGGEESPERVPPGDDAGADGGGTATIVANPAAYLTTMVTRLSLDRLRAARRERERYVGPWLAEPILTPFAWGAAAGTDADPAQTVELADTTVSAGPSRPVGSWQRCGPHAGRSAASLGSAARPAPSA